jgi:hypothetical protein
MKKSTLVKLVIAVVIIIGVITVNVNSFGVKNFETKSKSEKIADSDSTKFGFLLDEVTIIGKAPLK